MGQLDFLFKALEHTEMYRKTSPYIANPKRLADLIAAIQVHGTYRFASRRIEKWEKRLDRTPEIKGNQGVSQLDLKSEAEAPLSCH